VNLKLFGIMYTKKALVALLGGLTLSLAQTSSEKTPSVAEIEAARATTLPHSPVSNVKGKSFQRFINIWLENTVRLPFPSYYLFYTHTNPGL
jgi:acid phosphatase